MNVKQLKDKNGNNIQPNCPDKVGFGNWGGSFTNITANTNYTASEDGYVTFALNYMTGNLSECGIQINGFPVSGVYYNHATSLVEGFSISAPVKKGDVYRIYQSNLSSVSGWRRFYSAVRGGGLKALLTRLRNASVKLFSIFSTSRRCAHGI